MLVILSIRAVRLPMLKAVKEIQEQADWIRITVLLPSARISGVTVILQILESAGVDVVVGGTRGGEIVEKNREIVIFVSSGFSLFDHSPFINVEGM